MRALPLQCRFLALKKSIDDDRVLLGGGAAGAARSSPSHDSWAAIDCGADRVRKLNATTERNSFGIDRTVALAQPRAIRAGANLAFAGPINGDSRKQRAVRRKNRSRDQKSKANGW